MAQRIEHHPLDAAFAALLNNGLDGAGEALRILVNEASKIERAHFLNARPHERTAERTDYANGFKPKSVMTRVGQLTFDVPQVRGGGFYPSALEKGTRTEQALNIALAEMYVQGVSTRKVTDILVKLLGPRCRSPRPRSVALPSSSMPASRSGASGRWMKPRMSFSMPATSGCAKAGAWSIARCWWRSASRRAAIAGCWGCRSPCPRPRCIGALSSTAWSGAASRASS
jgi:hypothetical protein